MKFPDGGQSLNDWDMRISFNCVRGKEDFRLEGVNRAQHKQ